jgi:lipopolysaccharide transport system ATP-binding protein
MVFRTHIKVTQELRNPIFSLRISDANNISIIAWRSNDYVNEPLNKNINDNFIIEIETKNLFLLDSVYKLSISLLDGKELLDYADKFISFEILPDKPNNKFKSITKKKGYNGLIFNEGIWNISYS